MLRDDQVERYSRQILLPEIGGRGQERLLAASARILVTGDEPAAREAAAICGLHLAVAGVGRIGVDERAIAAGALAADVARLAGERTRDARVSSLDGGGDVAIAFGAPPELTPDGPLIVALAGKRRVVLFESGHGPCPRCLSAAATSVGERSGPLLSAAPFVAALAATSALRRLLGIGDGTPRVLAFDVAAAAPAATGDEHSGHRAAPG